MNLWITKKTLPNWKPHGLSQSPIQQNICPLFPLVWGEKTRFSYARMNPLEVEEAPAFFSSAKHTWLKGRCCQATSKVVNRASDAPKETWFGFWWGLSVFSHLMFLTGSSPRPRQRQCNTRHYTQCWVAIQEHAYVCLKNPDYYRCENTTLKHPTGIPKV